MPTLVDRFDGAGQRSSAIHRSVLSGQFQLETFQHLERAYAIGNRGLLEAGQAAIGAFKAIKHTSKCLDVVEEVVLVGNILKEVKATARKIDVHH